MNIPIPVSPDMGSDTSGQTLPWKLLVFVFEKVCPVTAEALRQFRIQRSVFHQTKCLKIVVSNWSSQMVIYFFPVSSEQSTSAPPLKGSYWFAVWQLNLASPSSDRGQIGYRIPNCYLFSISNLRPRE